MKYRPEIDGLRAVAVLPVILFHAHLGPLQGGFIGVDIFFVISGYLITSLLITEIERGSFSLLNFYERRMRRILPALFLVMFACIPFAILWMFPLELNDFFQSLFATTIFSSNILFWLESGYFSANSELKPLLHTWSLAIEEQYYIFFPLLLFLLWRGLKRVQTTVICLSLITLTSFALVIWGTAPWLTANFYLLPARAWELLAGALCAIALIRVTINPNGVLSALGIFLIAIGLIWSDKAVWPSWMTILPVAGTGLVILFGSSKLSVGRLLSSPPMVGIGLISYSAYLWHQPLLAFTRLRMLEEPSAWVYTALVFLSFGLAYLSWKYVEQPFRIRSNQAPQISRKIVFAASSLIGVGFIGLGLAGDATDGFPGRTAPSGRNFTQIVETVAGGRTTKLPCDTDITFRPINKEPLENCVFKAAPEKSNGKRAILIGDSHATVMSEAVRELFLNIGYDISIMSFGGCMPYPGYNLINRNCNTANEAVYAHVETSPYDLILVAGRPQIVIGKDSEALFLRDGKGGYKDRVLSLINNGIDRLLATGSTVVFVEPVPEMPIDIGQFIRKSYAFKANLTDIGFEYPYEAYLDRAGGVLNLLDKHSNPSLIRVHTANILCEVAANICRGIKNGVALYTDNNHLSKYGVAALLPTIEALVRKVP